MVSRWFVCSKHGGVEKRKTSRRSGHESVHIRDGWRTGELFTALKGQGDWSNNVFCGERTAIARNAIT